MTATSSSDPLLLQGDLSVDDRGMVSFVNAFDFAGVKRFYLVSNHRVGFVRAWHAHRQEAKFVAVVAGAALVAAVRIDNWSNPSKDATVHRYILSATRPAVLRIPPGYANGFMSLTPDALLAFFSTATVDESRADDVRYEANYWNAWDVIPR